MSGVPLDGERVLVTGGGPGLGAATSALASAGGHVAVAGVHGERAETEVTVLPTQETSWP